MPNLRSEISDLGSRFQIPIPFVGCHFALPRTWRIRSSYNPHMSNEFSVTHFVQFSETDMAGIVHFSNFFRWMEEVEHAYFRSLGLSVSMARFDLRMRCN